MGQLYILDLTKRAGSIDKAARGAGRDRISAHTVRTWNALPGQDHPKDAKGRWTATPGDVGGKLREFAGKLHPDTGKPMGDNLESWSRTDLESLRSAARLFSDSADVELDRRRNLPFGSPEINVGKPKPLKATKPKAAAKPIPAELKAKLAEIRKRPMPGDRAFMEGELKGLTMAQLQTLAPDDMKLQGKKDVQIQDLIGRYVGALKHEAIVQGNHDTGMSTPEANASRRAAKAEFERRKKIAVERGDREEYAALVAGYGTAGSGPGLPKEKAHAAGTSESLFGAEPLMGSKAWTEQERAFAAMTDEQKINDLTGRIGRATDKDRKAYLTAQRNELAAKAMGKPAPAAKPLKASKKPNDGSALTSNWMSGTFAMDIEKVITDPNPNEGSAELLRGLLGRLKVSELGELAKRHEVKLLGRTKKEKIDSFVASTVQNKRNSQAIREGAMSRPGERGFDVGAARPGTANLERLAGGPIKPGEFGPGSGKSNAPSPAKMKQLEDRVARLTVALDVENRRRSKTSRVQSAKESKLRHELTAAKRERDAARKQTGWAPGVHDDDAAEALDQARIDSMNKPSVTAGPTYLDTPRTVQGNGGFGPGSFHPDGRMGTAWQSLSAREASEDIGGMRLDDALAETMRMGYDGQPGRIGQQMARFQEIISQVKDPKVKKNLEYAFGQLKPQAPQHLTAKELADAPAPVHELMRLLETIPDTGQGGGEVARLAEIMRQWSAGQLRSLDMEVGRLGGYRHESQEGFHEMKRAVDKAFNDLVAMRRSIKRPEPDRSAEIQSTRNALEEARANLVSQYGEDPDRWPEARQDREVEAYYDLRDKLRRLGGKA